MALNERMTLPSRRKTKMETLKNLKNKQKRQNKMHSKVIKAREGTMVGWDVGSFVLDLLHRLAGFGVARVNDLRVMFDYAFDQSLRLKLLQCESGQTAADLQPLGNHGRGDQLVRRNFLHEFLKRWFVEEDQVVEFVSDFSLGPLLLLSLSAASFLGLLRRWRSRLSAFTAFVARLWRHLLSFNNFLELFFQKTEQFFKQIETT